MVYTILKTLVLPPGIFILLLILAFYASKGVIARLLIFLTTALRPYSACPSLLHTFCPLLSLTRR